jgi:hypothetical protein
VWGLLSGLQPPSPRQYDLAAGIRLSASKLRPVRGDPPLRRLGWFAGGERDRGGWHHTSGTPGPSFTHKGFLGVHLFFVISRFLITSLLLRERDVVGGILLRKFYARRALRIFPLYYATLLVYVVLLAATRRYLFGRHFPY